MSFVVSEPTSSLVENEEYSGGSTPPLPSIDDIMSRESIDEVMMSEVMNLENIKYQSSSAPETSRTESSENIRNGGVNIGETFSLFRVYFIYFFGLIVDTYFVYNFWNINIRIVRDTYYFSLYDSGLNLFSFAAVFAFLTPLLIIICIPSSCLYLSKQGFFIHTILYGICWLSFALSLIPSIEARVTFEAIFFVVFGFVFMLRISPSPTENLLRRRRFIDANLLSFFYVSSLRWVYIGYIPTYVSGWFAALNIFFGFLCLMYLFLEEIVMRICCPKAWDRTNDISKSGTLNVAKELYESVTPSKSYTDRITSILLWKFRSQRNIITRLPSTKNNEERLLCVRLYAFEVLIGIISVLSLVVFSLGLSVVFQLLTHFVLPPLSLPVWAGKQKYHDGLFVVFSLVLGIIIAVIARPNNNIEDYLGVEEDIDGSYEEKDEQENEDEITTSTKRRERKHNGWTLQNVLCSPIIFIGFFFSLISIFLLLSYTFNLNFVFWSGNICVILLPSIFEFFLGESVHFQYLQLHDLIDCPFYIYHLTRGLAVNVLTNYEGGISNDSTDRIMGRRFRRKRSSYVFRGPAVFVGCGYVFFVILLLSSVSVFAYHLFPGFGDVFGGKEYLVYILVVIFFCISSLSVCINKCVLLLRYRLFVGSRYLSCCSLRMVILLAKSIFFPRVVEYELLGNIISFEKRSRIEMIRASKAHERKQASMKIEMIHQEFQKSDEDDFDDLLEEGGDEVANIDHGIEEETSDDAEEEGEEQEEVKSVQVVKVEKIGEEKKQQQKEEEETENSGEVIVDEMEGSSEEQEEEEEDSKLGRIDDIEEEENEETIPKNETTPIIIIEDDEEHEPVKQKRKKFLQAFQICSGLLFRSIPRFFTCSSFCLLIPGFLFLFVGLISVPMPYDTQSSYHEDFFRLATFNVFHGYTFSGMDNGPQIANYFLKKQKIDFCGLQETCTARPETGYQDLIKYLGIMSYSKNYIQGKESREPTIGVSVVTRLPVGRVEDYLFDQEENGLDRMYQYLSVEMNGTVVNIINTHFDLEKDMMKSQANQLIEFCENNDLLSSDLPVIMMGDFNSEPNMTCLDVFYEYGFIDAYFEVTGRHDKTSGKDMVKGGGCVDYIFYRGTQLIPINAFVYNDEDYGLPRSSDHSPVVVDFKVLQSS